MICSSQECDKPLRSDNTTGYCRAHKYIVIPEHRARARSHRDRTRAWLHGYKLSQCCQDCGWCEHPAALQLDHEGEKTGTISSMRDSVTRMQREIENGKCVVRCANCHAIKTWAVMVGHSDPTGYCRDGDDCEVTPQRKLA